MAKALFFNSLETQRAFAPTTTEAYIVHLGRYTNTKKELRKQAIQIQVMTLENNIS